MIARSLVLVIAVVLATGAVDPNDPFKAAAYLARACMALVFAILRPRSAFTPKDQSA